MYIEIGIDNPSQWELVKVALLSFSGEKKAESHYTVTELGHSLSKRKMKQYPSERICGNTRY